MKKKRGLLGLIWKIGSFLLLLLIFYELHFVLQIFWFKYFDPVSTPFTRSEEARLNDKTLVEVKYKWVDFNQISPYLVQALVADEDAQFMNHSGVDWEAFKKAAYDYLFSNRKAPGGSTLTQQTVKNLFLSHERSLWRKAQEIFLSPIVEFVWGKKRILETYLNIAEFGEGVFGAEEAAQHYFKTSAAKLNKNQAVWLASILINPKVFQNKNHRSKLLAQRTKRIQHDMNLVKVPSAKD
ncbi:MAG: monofunctional biosynthetic peptidoglycan transglycosylase [Burkholderiales bacterium]|nr:monofunctional biosynthetic peptidoglycan transglycosylase [Burkholderiales bacterium]